MGRIGFFLLCLLCGNAHASTDIYELFTVKWGEIRQSEQWQGKVLLIGDVRVAPDATVTVTPGTWLVFSDYDVENIGSDNTRPELIIDGQLKTVSGVAPKILTLHDEEVQALLARVDSQQKIEVAAQKTDVTPLYSQWRDYGVHYAYIWAILYSLWLVF